MRKTFWFLCALAVTAAFPGNLRAGVNVPGTENGPAASGAQIDAIVDGAWATNSPIPTPNGTSQTTTAADSAGNIYVIGGGAGPGPDITLSAVLRYTPADDSWTPVASLSAPLRAFGAAVAMNDTFYVFGGYNGISPVNTTNIYDVASDTWSQGANIPPAGGGFGVAAGIVQGRIFIAGGSNAPNSTFEYDPAADAYTPRANIVGSGMVRCHGVGIDDLSEFHIFGNGFDGRDHRVYNVDTDTWAMGPLMPAGVTDPAVVAIGTNIYVIGGILGPAQTQIYDAVNQTWSAGPTLPGPTNNTSGALSIDPAGAVTIYVEGGFDGANSIPVNYSLAQ